MNTERKCGGCSGTLVNQRWFDQGGGWLWDCASCGGLNGEMYLGVSYLLVRPTWAPGADTIPAERTRYFDLMCLGSEGVTRRHGWYDPASKGLVQIG